MLTNQELNNLACEVIETFNKYNVTEYRVMLKDKYYDGYYKSWVNEKINMRDYEGDGYIWSDEFNLFIDGYAEVMFSQEPDTIHEWLDFGSNKKDSRSLIQCYAKLRRIFRRYGLEWKTLDYGLKVTFREKDLDNNISKVS